MGILGYRIIQATCLAVFLVSVILLAFILVWLIEGHGVVACGKGIFDSPTWLFDVTLFIGVPALLSFVAGWLFLWCSNRSYDSNTIVAFDPATVTPPRSPGMIDPKRSL